MPVIYKDVASAAASSVTLPTHVPGDIIVICAARLSTSSTNTTPPTAPSASGTVPTWSTITANTGTTARIGGVADYAASCRIAYTVATASNHTSGTWTNATRIGAVVLNGSHQSSPIGGNSESGGTSTTTSTAPAVTLTSALGDSAILQFHMSSFNSAWSAAPSGYTQRSATTSPSLCINTKNTTTADGSVAQTFASTGVGAVPVRGATIEILAAPPGQFFPFIQ